MDQPFSKARLAQSETSIPSARARIVTYNDYVPLTALTHLVKLHPQKHTREKTLIRLRLLIYFV
jgi:hypothetical protein